MICNDASNLFAFSCLEVAASQRNRQLIERIDEDLEQSAFA